MCQCHIEKQKNCHSSSCNYNSSTKAIIAPTTLTVSTIVPITLSTNCDYKCRNIIIGTNSIIFHNIGIYCLKGYIDIINQSTAVTNFQIIANILSGGGVINPNSVTYSGIKANTPFTAIFNFVIQVSVPNTTLQLLERSTSAPTLITSGKIKITRVQ